MKRSLFIVGSALIILLLVIGGDALWLKIRNGMPSPTPTSTQIENTVVLPTAQNAGKNPSTICKENNLDVLGLVPIRFANQSPGGAGDLMFCGTATATPPQKRVLYIFDENGKIVVQDEFAKDYNGPSVEDVNGDKKEEVYWAARSCTNPCTQCTTTFHLYSASVREKFTVIEKDQMDKACINKQKVLSREYSSNLQKEEYKSFLEYLENKVYY
ncbi:MAG: hypothetical protein HYW95_01625 [Candidatus Wildermuthbacteria bacterium]|nr:hypothetical protein [Candidatus Wildermuthbacteria bacterium]